MTEQECGALFSYLKPRARARSMARVVIPPRSALLTSGHHLSFVTSYQFIYYFSDSLYFCKT